MHFLPLVFLLALAAEPAPAIKLVSPTTIDVTGVDAKTLAGLKPDDIAACQKLFALYVENDRGSTEGQPATLGTYRVDKGTLRFTPRFPLRPGVRYRSVLNTGGKSTEAVLFLPKVERKPTATVVQVYPTTDKVPENLLKFYLHFSAPMRQGGSYQHVELLDSKGKPVDLPFLELDQELWNPEGTRFTLFFDPGRIKRGLKPREEFGPVLEEGKKYTLVIHSTWKDADGTPMKQSFRKSFTALAPDDNPPDHKTWKFTTTPAAGTTDALRVTFPKSMDHALAERLIWLEDADGKRVEGKVSVSDRETVWQFTPDAPWKAGKYHLVADTRLEDLAGNGIGRPFEIDVLRPIERKIKTDTVRLPIEILRAKP